VFAAYRDALTLMPYALAMQQMVDYVRGHPDLTGELIEWLRAERARLWAALKDDAWREPMGIHAVISCRIAASVLAQYDTNLARQLMATDPQRAEAIHKRIEENLAVMNRCSELREQMVANY
jgi:hypothetical protein